MDGLGKTPNSHYSIVRCTVYKSSDSVSMNCNSRTEAAAAAAAAAAARFVTALAVLFSSQCQMNGIYCL
jgi:hypothetical protein